MQCRHRGKINIQRPKKGTLDRRIFEAVTQQVVIKPPPLLCTEDRKVDIVLEVSYELNS